MEENAVFILFSSEMGDPPRVVAIFRKRADAENMIADIQNDDYHSEFWIEEKPLL
jgi:hypothetical protein